MIGMAADKCCGQAPPIPRRSIPVDEVEEIIKREVANVKSELTIYDERLRIMSALRENEAEVDYHGTVLHRLEIRNKQISKEFARINLAIKRQMELDGE